MRPYLDLMRHVRDKGVFKQDRTGTMSVAVVLAVASNGVIGRDNQLPWHIPEDLRHFKRITLGKPVLMGRKTFESIGKPLPGRVNVVVTRDRGWTAPSGVEVVHGVREALALAGRLGGGGEVIVIGGASLVRAALPVVDRFYLTEIHRPYEGDATIPTPNPAVWKEISREDHEGDPPFSFVVLERR